MLRLARLRDHLGRMEQRLGGDAAAIEADPAQFFFLLHQDDFLTQVGGVKGRSVTAGPGAQHNNISMNRIHS